MLRNEWKTILLYIAAYSVLVSGCCGSSKTSAPTQDTATSPLAALSASPPASEVVAAKGASKSSSRSDQTQQSKKPDKKSASTAAPNKERGEITLTWNPVPGAAWYNLYYDTRPGVTRGKSRKITRIPTTTRTVTGLTMGTTYFFVVTAGNEDTESPLSGEISGKPARSKKPEKSAM